MRLLCRIRIKSLSDGKKRELKNIFRDFICCIGFSFGFSKTSVCAPSNSSTSTLPMALFISFFHHFFLGFFCVSLMLRYVCDVLKWLPFIPSPHTPSLLFLF